MWESSCFAHSGQISPPWVYKCGPTAPQITKIGIFAYKFAQKGYTPLSDFYKIWLGGGSPRSASSYQIWPFCVLKNMGLQPQKSRKIAIFWYKFAHVEKFWGSTEKVEYRGTTTNLSACNDTIIVLIIILLHSVSVITNFVIPKRDKDKKTSHFFVYSRRTTHDPHHTRHGHKKGPYHFLHSLTFLIRSVVSPLGAIENFRENAHTAGKCL